MSQHYLYLQLITYENCAGESSKMVFALKWLPGILIVCACMLFKLLLKKKHIRGTWKWCLLGVSGVTKLYTKT